MAWPVGLWIMWGVAAAVSVVPWLMPSGRAGGWLVPVPVVVATLCWWLYEQRLGTMFPPGDPVIRVDLLLLVPLMAIAWGSTLAALATRARRALRRRSKPSRDAAGEPQDH